MINKGDTVEITASVQQLEQLQIPLSVLAANCFIVKSVAKNVFCTLGMEESNKTGKKRNICNIDKYAIPEEYLKKL